MAAFNEMNFKDEVMAGSSNWKATGFEGWYTLAYNGGSFEVCLRPGGTFFAPKYQAKARWCMESGAETPTLLIDWKKFGLYKLMLTQPALDGKPAKFEGGVASKMEDWRTATYSRPISPAETLLIGPTGKGSEWKFFHEGGHFLIEFRGDGHNHFVCADFPAHSHWDLGGAAGDELSIAWGRYGTYDLKLDAAAASGAGSARGDPAQWRKMTLVRDLTAADVAAAGGCGHDHGHEHEHGAGCGHAH